MNRKWCGVPDPKTCRLFWLGATRTRSFWSVSQSLLSNSAIRPLHPLKGRSKSLCDKANWRQWWRTGINQGGWFNDKSVPPNEILQRAFKRGCSDFQQRVALAYQNSQGSALKALNFANDARSVSIFFLRSQQDYFVNCHLRDSFSNIFQTEKVTIFFTGNYKGLGRERTKSRNVTTISHH